MKIVLICPSNLLYMPYVNNYTTILNEENINYDIINWDRFGIEEASELTYRDSKIGHQRGSWDYLKYSRFILGHLKKNDYDKIIVFGIQLTFFLQNYLIKKYKNKFIIDIRDYNKIMRCFNISKIVNSSAIMVLSSPGYKEWLPDGEKYILNHNTSLEDLEKLVSVKTNFTIGNGILVGCIGALRDYQVNIDLIDSLKNSDYIYLNYHGEGDINFEIEKYLVENEINNVSLTGRYAKPEEEELYLRNNIINVLRYNDGINNRTALPNRLYNAVIYGRPMIAYTGTYLSEVIEDYGLGLVIDSFMEIEFTIRSYLETLDINKYNDRRTIFLEKIIEENNQFYMKLKEFIKQ